MIRVGARVRNAESDVRVRDLRLALDEVRGIFVSSGARAQQKTLGDVSEALSPHDDDDLDMYLGRVGEATKASAAPIEDQYVKLLFDAGADEVRFLAALDKLAADKKLKKAGLQKIAKKFAGTISRTATAPQIIDAIKLAFYRSSYERDARELARKAKPV